MKGAAVSRSAPSRLHRSVRGVGATVLLAGTLIAIHIVGVFGDSPSWRNAPLMLLAVAAQCWLFTGLFIAAHDAMHGSLAPAWPKLNAALGAVILFAYAGFGWRRMRDAHFDHHRFSGTARDPDFDGEGRSFLHWYAVFVFRYFGWGSLAYLALLSAAHVTLFGADLNNLLLFHATPSILSSIQLFAFGTYLPHRRCSARFVDRHNARSQAWHPCASLITCFHFGYHHEHHLRPGEPWWRLPSVHRQLSEEHRA